MKKAAALAAALRNAGTPGRKGKTAPPTKGRSGSAAAPVAQPSRKGTAAITVHHPEEVRRQLKTLAAAQGRLVDDVVAEAFNLLFAKYRKPEIAPRRPATGHLDL
jgi:hypothetical protein